MSALTTVLYGCGCYDGYQDSFAPPAALDTSPEALSRQRPNPTRVTHPALPEATFIAWQGSKCAVTGYLRTTRTDPVFAMRLIEVRKEVDSWRLKDKTLAERWRYNLGFPDEYYTYEYDRELYELCGRGFYSLAARYPGTVIVFRQLKRGAWYVPEHMGKGGGWGYRNSIHIDVYHQDPLRHIGSFTEGETELPQKTQKLHGNWNKWRVFGKIEQLIVAAGIQPREE